MTLPDILFCGFSLLGLCLVPAALGRNAWGVLSAFAGLGLMLFIAPAPLHPARNAWVGLALSQGPWILLAFDLIVRGRVAREIEPVSLRAWLAFSLVHLLALRHLLSAAQGELPALFAFETAFSALLLSACALLLWAVNRPGNAWYRGLLVFWNTWGLVTTLEQGFRMRRADPEFPFTAWARPSQELHAYFTGWPGALDAFFWTPLAASIHLAIFYKLLTGRRREAHVAAASPPIS